VTHFCIDIHAAAPPAGCLLIVLDP
jgi:hypothetical protein